MTKEDIETALKIIIRQVAEHNKCIEELQKVVQKMNNVFIELQKELLK